MGHDRVDVRIEGPENDVLDVERALGEDTIGRLALAARRFDVMISLTVTPFDATDRDEVVDDALDR